MLETPKRGTRLFGNRKSQNPGPRTSQPEAATQKAQDPLIKEGLGFRGLGAQYLLIYRNICLNLSGPSYYGLRSIPELRRNPVTPLKRRNPSNPFKVYS